MVGCTAAAAWSVTKLIATNFLAIQRHKMVKFKNYKLCNNANQYFQWILHWSINRDKNLTVRKSDLFESLGEKTSPEAGGILAFESAIITSALSHPSVQIAEENP